MKITLDIDDSAASTVVRDACLQLGVTVNDDEEARLQVGNALVAYLRSIAVSGAIARKRLEEQAESKSAVTKIGVF